jgi:dihydroorotate dehydrogenase
MYNLLRQLLFLLPAETAHQLSMNLLKAGCSFVFIRKWLSGCFQSENNCTATNIGKLHFKNPLGLSAGFDKNAKYLRELETLGFGFVEIGTVTPRPQAGNDKPRLFRLPKDKALVNRMGFNNDGVSIVAQRLKEYQLITKDQSGGVSKASMLIGGNIGKNKSTPNDEAWKDYEICFRALHPYVHFFVVNVSSPNTPGLRQLQEKDSLKLILSNLQLLNSSFTQKKPIFLKIAPDLSQEQVDDIIELSTELQLDGLVAANTTISRENLIEKERASKIGAGGLSGLPVQKRSTELIQYIHQKTQSSIPIIGSGGIFSGQDAAEKLTAGASLIEVWTGFIYEGPFIVKRICNYLQRQIS